MTGQNPTQKTSKRTALLCICLLIFGVSLVFRLMKMLLDPVLMRDSVLYLSLAESWFETGNYAHTLVDTASPPLPLWSIKTFLAAGFNAEVAGRSLSIFFGSLTPVAGFLFTLKLCNNIRIALISALLLAIHPGLVAFSVQPLRENYYIFFDGLLLAMIAVSIKKDSMLNWGLCGFFLSLAYFCRFEAVEFLLIVPFIIAVLFFCRKIKFTQAFLNASAFSLCFLLMTIFLLSFVDFETLFITRDLPWLRKYIP